VIEVRAEVGPRGPYRLPRPSGDGLVRRREGVLFRFLRTDGHDVLLRAARLRDGRVVLGARACPLPAGRAPVAWPPAPGAAPDGPAGRRAAAELARAAAVAALGRWRFALGVDADLRPFVAAHGDDPLIGPSIRTRPWLAPQRRPSVFEALLCAVCEQLIAYEDALRIERRLIARHGAARAPDVPSHPRLRDAPDAAGVGLGLVPAQLEACGLSPKRAAALHRAAREIATGRIDAGAGCDPDRVLLRLGRLPEIGTWTLALVASQALGRDDRPPSGDLNLRKALGRILTGDPRARVPEHEVDAWLDRYAPWGALAAAHLMSTRGDLLPGRGAGTVPAPRPAPPARHPSLAGLPPAARRAPAAATRQAPAAAPPPVLATAYSPR
jgi:3-methyladenine DNA glycosylase/8-oxoguanine DNA glycosylase